MITWGLMAAAMAFVQGATSFLVLRFLLGIAEAGFFPGVILYFTYWFPKQYRGRVIAALFLAVPGSNALTAVISGALLGLDGVLGIPGWKWLYIVEAAPAVLLAFVVLRYLTEKPEVADWLLPDEKQWLVSTLEAERLALVGKSGGHMPLQPGAQGQAGAGAVDGLLHDRDGNLWHYVLPAADREGPRRLRHAHRPVNSRALRGRHHWNAGLEPVLGPQQGAQMALHHRLPAWGGRSRSPRAHWAAPMAR